MDPARRSYVTRIRPSPPRRVLADTSTECVHGYRFDAVVVRAVMIVFHPFAYTNCVDFELGCKVGKRFC